MKMTEKIMKFYYFLFKVILPKSFTKIKSLNSNKIQKYLKINFFFHQKNVIQNFVKKAEKSLKINKIVKKSSAKKKIKKKNS